MPRLDSRLESEGAEFLVLGNLLLNRIAAYKTYTNMPGYDVVATNPEANTSAKIQVKSRWRTGATAFPISNFDCDFVVAAFLNRGLANTTQKSEVPKFYVFPVAIIQSLPRGKVWSKVDISKVPDLQNYLENWNQVAVFLCPNGVRPPAPVSPR